MSAAYHHTEAIHNLTAAREVVPLVMQSMDLKSVLDVGCGTGTWLKVFEEAGIRDYAGVDGSYLDKSLLNIPSSNFIERDLRQSFSLGRKFDLVLSLEVAEHLEERYADEFVKSLINHGDTILFSAAIPGQGGQHHHNEQWPVYWEKKFEQQGFYFHDVIRPQIWNNEKVDWWYRQNIFLVSRQRQVGSNGGVIASVHPMLFDQTLKNQVQYLDSLKQGRQGLKLSASIFFNAVVFKLKSLLGLRS